MKILQVNTVYSVGSTGKIAAEIHDSCVKNGIECITAYRYVENKDYPDTVAVSSWFDCHFHNRLYSYTMLQGCFSYFKTKKFLKWVSRYDPDIIHLHNIHGSYINHRLLFNYLKKTQRKVIWTLHDCWAFTGYCPHYDFAGCQRWKTTCHHCPAKVRGLDCSRWMHKKKKKWFSGVKDMILVANSEWTAAQAKYSFLSHYPIQVIYNGIDTEVFRPTASDFKIMHGCENKRLVLGVAFVWGAQKGLDVFIELALRLPDDYQIILVGTDDDIDKLLPDNILSIHRTACQRELAEIYSAADVFINPTREEAFGLVNIEALACGTPGVAFNTGGCSECYDEHCGVVVAKDDIDAMEREIKRICETSPYRKSDCLSFAKQFSKEQRYLEYIELYKKLCNE